MPSACSRVGWSEREPTPADWAGVQFSAVDDPASTTLVDLLAAFAGAFAAAQAATFAVEGLTPTLTRWLHEDHGDQHPFVTRLLTSIALLEAMPEHDTPAPAKYEPPRNPSFAWINPLHLSASLAVHLSDEGAYQRGPTPSAAKLLTDTYVESTVEGRFQDFHVADSNDAWSGFFHDVVSTWEHTWTVTDLSRNRITIITVADTD